MKKKIFIALDNMEKDEILEIVGQLKDKVMFKINDAFTKYGPDIVKEIHNRGGEVFLDLKFHDIPSTVANYAKQAAKLGVYMFNIHCLGGVEMMEAARKAIDKHSKGKKPLLIGVTILTSMDDELMKEELKINVFVETMVEHFAKLAKKVGLDGVVCSPEEIKVVKDACGKDFITVTPGVRPAWATADDQRRIVSPQEAHDIGSDYIVIGRPIIQADQYDMTRVEAAEKIIDEMEGNI
ncbi:orotidine-5'-phosphate decarboxylase [Candidatus Woesearchaeota archaeon]|nr:orotidine-5'-phosphate decarboxylase [Candidatus Woesearchaeota archaeon]